MKKVLPMILIISLIMFVFSGCGNNADIEYSATMKSGAESGEFGNGDRIAVYNTKSETYVKMFIGEDYLAETPEQVGAILSFTNNEVNYDFVLTDARDNTEISKWVFTSKDFDKRTILDNGKSADYVEDTITRRWQAYQKQRVYLDIYVSGETPAGNKLIYYDKLKDVFGDHHYLPDEMEASSPEEVGAFLLVQEEGVDKYGSISVTLCCGKSSSQIIASWVFEEDSSSSSIQSWVEEKAKAYFIAREYADALAVESEGGGDKIIGFDTDHDRYTGRLIPDDLLATSPSETALIARISSDFNIVQGSYSLFSFAFTGASVDLDLETVNIELEDPKTGHIYGWTTITAEEPQSVFSGTEYVKCEVTTSQVEEWLREQLNSFLLSGN